MKRMVHATEYFLLGVNSWRGIEAAGIEKYWVKLEQK